MLNGIVAIIGRPNTGKSTLFNRLTRSHTAIIADEPGVTRDRIYGQVVTDQETERGFTLIDTGGFETKGYQFQPFQENLVWQQTEAAIKEADLIVLLLDGKDGLHQYDTELHTMLKQLGKDYLCVVNKIDGDEKIVHGMEFYALGIDHLLMVSAAHNKGITALLEQIQSKLDAAPIQQSHRERVIHASDRRLAILGRPNAGKSSLLNRLIGEERSLVSPLAGTTRDSLDTVMTYNKKPYVLIDTAGIRRKTKVNRGIEAESVIASLRAMDRCDMVIYVIEALEKVTDQDARLINLAVARKKPLLLIVNKWDLYPDKHTHSTRDYLREITPFLPQCQVQFISCLTNQRVHSIMKVVEELFIQNEQRASTAEVNRALVEITQRHPHPMVGTRSVRFYYATQTKKAPPTFVIMSNAAHLVTKNYERYLQKQLSAALGFTKVPIHLVFRSRDSHTTPHQESLQA